jgi:hypothetical protein
MLLDVPAALIEQSADVVVVELVVDLAPDAAGADDPKGAEQAELVGDGRLGQTDDLREIRDAQLGVGERIHEPDPGRVAEDRERRRELFGRALAQQARIGFASEGCGA